MNAREPSRTPRFIRKLKRRWKRWAATALFVLLACTFAAAVYLVVSALPHVQATRAALPLDSVEGNRLDRASDHLRSIDRVLNSVPARFLSLVPVARQNVTGVRASNASLLAAIDEARLAGRSLDDFLEGTSGSGRLVDIEALDELGDAIERQRARMQDLESATRSSTNGWLLPPVWEGLHELNTRARELHSTLEGATRALDVAPAMLGMDGRRLYLVLMVNNSELRGAGGIVSGVGTLVANRGRFRVGEFEYYVDIARRTPEGRVPSPPDFERRFARYDADTNMWVNLSASPDVPEVAEVGASLYERATGRRVDGVVLIDPIGLAALLPPTVELDLSGAGISETLSASRIPDFVYSGSYELFDQDGSRRRDAVIEVGKVVLDEAFGRGLSREVVDNISAAIGGGHLRLVSLRDDEASVLEDLGASGALATEARDSLLVTVQNLGADKLDFHMRRSVTHECDLSGEATRCVSTVVLRNEVPKGLPTYVTQRKRRYGSYQGYLEMYVPGAAEVTGTALDGEVAEVFIEEEDGRQSVGLYFETLRNRSTVMEVSYRLPGAPSDYSLEITPQPLTRPADVTVRLQGLPGGVIEEGRMIAGDTFDLETTLTERVRVDVASDPRTGIPALWESVRRFWNRPLLTR